MEYIYAGMLLHKAGKEVTEESVKKVLEAAGITPEEGRVKALVAALDGVDIDAAIKEAAVAPAAAPAAAAPAEGAEAAPAAEEKKEEKKEEEEKKDSAAGLGALFG